MAATRAQIAAIFPDNPVDGLRGGDGWHTDCAARDFATIHHVKTGAFGFSLEGATAFDGPGFCAYAILLRSGRLSVGQTGHERVLTAGDIFVACGWRPLTLDGEGDIEALILKLPAFWAMQHFLDGFLILPDLYVPNTYFAAPIISRLVDTLFDPVNEDDVTAQQALAMFADLMRTSLTACVDTNDKLPRWQGRMGAILEFMMQNLDTPGLSAQDAATSLKCSVRTIYKTCADYGTSFNAFLNEIRLVTAQHQLMRTNERISQIAYGVGFVSLSHFSHLFRARFGMSAKAMREERGMGRAV